jgi:hypothetical protein
MTVSVTSIPVEEVLGMVECSVVGSKLIVNICSRSAMLRGILTSVLSSFSTKSRI